MRPKRPAARANPPAGPRTDWGGVADWYDQLVGEAGSEYHRKVVLPGTVRLLADGTARLIFDQPVWGAAPGQLAVFYEGDRVIGGGTIDSTARSGSATQEQVSTSTCPA